MYNTYLDIFYIYSENEKKYQIKSIKNVLNKSTEPTTHFNELPHHHAILRTTGTIRQGLYRPREKPADIQRNNVNAVPGRREGHCVKGPESSGDHATAFGAHEYRALLEGVYGEILPDVHVF